MRIVFGIMTATESPDAVRQLVETLGSKHAVVLHHDHRKRGPLVIDAPHVHLIQDPADTGWGTWGFCEGVLKTVAAAIELGPFDYFQLLSGSCLPIKPIEVFEAHLGRQAHDVNIGLTELVPGSAPWFSHGYRLYHPLQSLTGRIMRKAGLWHVEPGRLVDWNGLTFHVREEIGTVDLVKRLKRRAGTALFRTCSSRYVKHTPFHEGVRPFMASTWFGCSAEAARFLADRKGQESLEAHLKSMHLVDETYFATRFGNSAFRLGPSNHLISRFDGPHPVPFTEDDLLQIGASSAFFARKFPLQIDARVRTEVRRQVLGS